MNLAQQIEAILFWKAEPVTLKKLATLLKVDVKSIKIAAQELAVALQGRGVVLVQTDDEVMLGTAKELSPIIADLAKEELTRDLGKAGLETLSIILYQGPISRADIDYIRGVNSQFILRALLVRGMTERVVNPADSRSFLYKPTLALLAHLGITDMTKLPELEQVRKDIESFKQAADSEPASATIES